MGEFFFTFLFFFAAISLASVFFFGWVIYLAVKAVWWMVGGVLGTVRRQGTSQLRPCTHLRCQQLNPVTARYCRRCGRTLSVGGVSVPRKAAAA